MRFFCLTFAVLALGAVGTVRAEMKCLAPDEGIAEVGELVDDEVVLAKYGETASVVAFERLPRPNILHTWKSLGVTVLKTMCADPELSPEHFRREAGFRALTDGADGIYLPAAPTGEWARALAEAKEDWRVLEYAKGLWEKARASEEGLVRIEGRRAMFFLHGFFPCGWENLDALRLECTAWAKRLEQILALPAADLPTTVPEKQLPDYAVFKPYAGREGTIASVKVGEPGTAVGVPGLSFRWTADGFAVIFETHEGRELADRWSSPGGAVDFRLYLPGKEPDEWMPYRYHCDLNPQFKDWGRRAPAVGRGSFLFGTDERFLPYSQAYGVSNGRITEWPRLRSHGPDCPDLRPSFGIEPVKGGGFRATLSVSWMRLYGRWPMQGTGTRGDVWYMGVDRAPGTDAPLVLKLRWPKPKPTVFNLFCDRFSTAGMTAIYKEELARTHERWKSGFRDRYYEFLKTKEPTFNIGDRDSDEMFRTRLLQPLIDANQNAWDLIRTDKEQPKPAFLQQPEPVRRNVFGMLGRMFYLSHQAGILRRDYLAGRFAGKVPPEVKAKPKPETASDWKRGPNADADEEVLELDEKEF